MWNFSEDIKQMIETGEKLRKQIEERERAISKRSRK